MHHFPAHLASEYASGYMPSGAPTQQDSRVNLSEVANRPMNLREDGYDPERRDYFGKRWVQEEANLYELVRQNPDYDFLAEVAGFAAREPQMFLDKEALDQNARRMLQRAAVADKLSESALAELDHAESLLKDLQKRGGDLVNAHAGVLHAHVQLTSALARWSDMAKQVLAQTNSKMYPEERPESVDAWPNIDCMLSFYARMKSPSDGVDSPIFAEKLLALLVSMAQGENGNAADARIPRELHLCVFWTFALYVSRTIGAIEYTFRRMKASNAFPANSMYATEPTQRMFIDDVRRLVDLVAGGFHAKHPISMTTMSPLFYIHARCMLSRWYTAEATSKVDSPVCDTAPLLLQPRRREQRQRGPNRIKIVGQTQQEIDAASMLFVEETDALNAAQREEMTTVNPDQYQNLFLAILGALYNNGVATLFYEMPRIRGLLCKEAANVAVGELCKDTDESYKQLRLVASDYTLMSAVVTLEYLFGGMDVQEFSIIPSTTWIETGVPSENDARQATTLYTFIANSMGLFRALLQTQATDREWFPDAADLVLLPPEQQQATTYEARHDRIFRFLRMKPAEIDAHKKVRNLAALQVSGLVDALAELIRSYTAIRETVGKYADVGGLSGDLVIPALLSAEDERSIMEKRESPSVRRMLFHLIDDGPVGDEEQKRAAVEDQAAQLLEQVDRLDGALGDRVRLRNNDLLTAERGVLGRLTKRFSINANSSAEMIGNLKQALAETYIQSGEWAMRPENSGVLLVSDKYRSAVNSAYEATQALDDLGRPRMPNLYKLTMDTLKRSETKVAFAKLAAAKIQEAELRNPAGLTLNNASSHNVNHQRRILQELQNIPRPKEQRRIAAPGPRNDTALPVAPILKRQRSVDAPGEPAVDAIARRAKTVKEDADADLHRRMSIDLFDLQRQVEDLPGSVDATVYDKPETTVTATEKMQTVLRGITKIPLKTQQAVLKSVVRSMQSIASDVVARRNDDSTLLRWDHMLRTARVLHDALAARKK